MRARLAIFVAAAIVFAPGASSGSGSLQPPAIDVAARMLAPTFDDLEVAAYQAAAYAKKAQEQGRRHFPALLALAALAGAFSFINSRFADLLTERIQRQIRRVASSHRDRGPPHLQLA
jgi:hypothetical protein